MFGDLLNDMITPEMKSVFDLTSRLCLLFFVVFSAALIFWTWRDAQRRGAMPWFWALVVLIFNVFGWMVYMVVRPPEYLDDARERDLEIAAKEAELHQSGKACPSCHRPTRPDFLVCPWCMTKLRKECVSCGKALDLDWGICPYCKTKQ